MPKDIDNLIHGYRNFKKNFFQKEKAFFKKLIKENQRPKILIIACSDSRVDPSIIFNCNPGDLFVIRNIANIVPPCVYDNLYHGTSAALEFGIRTLKIKHVIVLGHSHCGGIGSILNDHLDKSCEEDFISKWMKIVIDTTNKEELIKSRELIKNNPKIFFNEIIKYGKQSLINSIKNLLTFPWIKSLVINDCLYIHAWYFNLSSGNIEIYDSSKKSFISINKINDFKSLNNRISILDI